MAVYRKSIIAVGLAIVGGCSMEDAHQLGYATVQSMGQQQCQKAMVDDCDQKQNYETYQRERQQIDR